MNDLHVTQQALSILRSGESFQWYVITLLALTIYVYINEVTKKNWKGIAAGLSLYAVHWFYEILNALIQHFSGHALWTVPTGTVFLLLIGVGVELSLMFSVAGLILSKLLPEDPKQKIFGLINRLLFAIGNAAFFPSLRFSSYRLLHLHGFILGGMRCRFSLWYIYLSSWLPFMFTIGLRGGR